FFGPLVTTSCIGTCGNLGSVLEVIDLDTVPGSGMTSRIPALSWQHLGQGENWTAGGGAGGIPNPDDLIKFSSFATGIGNNSNPQLISLRLSTDATNGRPYLNWQSTSTGFWNWYGELPNPNGIGFSAVATGKGNGGNLQVIGLGNLDGFPYLIHQSQSTGQWAWNGLLPTPSSLHFNALA